MNTYFLDYLSQTLQNLKVSGLYKEERILESAQSALIKTSQEGEVINLCANNYLGLANHPEIIQAAKEGLELFGYGLSSVRFICGTQSIHKRLEKRLSKFLQTEDTQLYSSCFDANTGLFEALLGPEDVIISDELNHASIIDGIRLCKAKRLRYHNNDMSDLQSRLREAQGARFILIATDGVFSMDGGLADLPEICALAREYNALVLVDDSHAVGVMGHGGRGTPEYFGVTDEIDIITGTLGKALGGASGGYVSGKKQIIEWLRQSARPYLFSNSVAPMIVYASQKALDLVESMPELRERLQDNSRFFRHSLTSLGFDVLPGDHPIIPVMLYDATLSTQFAENLLREGIYVISFSYPVVPKENARIRTQLSALHSKAQLEQAVAAFEKVGKRLGVIH